MKEFFEIAEPSSLDELIGNLVALQNRLPAGAQPEMKLSGDGGFGGILRISYFRDSTVEEESFHRRCEVGTSTSGHRWIFV